MLPWRFWIPWYLIYRIYRSTIANRTACCELNWQYAHEFFCQYNRKSRYAGHFCKLQNKQNKIFISVLDYKDSMTLVRQIALWLLQGLIIHSSLDTCSGIKVSLKNHAVKLIVSGEARDGISAAASNRNHLYISRLRCPMKQLPSNAIDFWYLLVLSINDDNFDS
jgi:hypothetical protein